jgi:CHRD domain-containing protein
VKALRLKLAAGVAVLGVAGVATAAVAHDRSRFDASLTGYEETPTLSTQGHGFFKATISRGKDEIHYVLSYTGPFDANPAGGTVTQAHIHLGAPAIAGGVSAFLCTNLGNGPAGTPACPPNAGTVTGTITPAQVVGPAAQGIAPGEFAELVRALRAGAAYANIHTTAKPAGEIRGQISSDDDDRHGDD